MKRGAAMLLAACLAVILTSCGYHEAGHNNKLPTELHTLAIPVFVNNSQTYRIEQDLTAAVVHEFVARTRYHVVSREDRSADATLRGTVLYAAVGPLTLDSRTGRVATVLVQVGIKATLTDKGGKVLYDNPSYVFREQYQISSSSSSFFQEQSPAMERLSRDFAGALVSDVLETY